MAMTLEELTKSLKYGSYAPKTEAEIQRQAQAKYEEELAQSTLAAQQAYERTAQAIESRQGQLGAAYDRQSAAAREQTARTYSAADRQALSRGMQRSSYNNQTLANINLRGDETQDRIAQARREEEAALAGEKSLAAQQLAQQIAQYQKANQSQVSAYGEQLREQEYQRRMEQDKYYNQLQAMLYEYGLQEAKTSGGRGGGRSSGGNINSANTNIVNPEGAGSPSTNAFLDALNSGSFNKGMAQHVLNSAKTPSLTFDSGERFTAVLKPNGTGTTGGVTITNLTKDQVKKMQKNPVNPKMGVFSPTLTITKQNMAK